MTYLVQGLVSPPLYHMGIIEKSTEIKAPEKQEAKGKKTIFVAGAIDMGEAEDWQTRLANELDDYDVVLYNPRRDDWDSSWEQNIENPEFREQVEWELKGQENADVIAMNFTEDSKAPISLLELGLFARTGKLIVCCPKGFYRKGNVDIVCKRYNVTEVDNWNDFVDEIKSRLGEDNNMKKLVKGIIENSKLPESTERLIDQSITEEQRASDDYEARAKLADEDNQSDVAHLYRHIAPEEDDHKEEFEDIKSSTMVKGIIEKDIDPQIPKVMSDEEMDNFQAQNGSVEKGKEAEKFGLLRSTPKSPQTEAATKPRVKGIMEKADATAVWTQPNEAKYYPPKARDIQRTPTQPSPRPLLKNAEDEQSIYDAWDAAEGTPNQFDPPDDGSWMKPKNQRKLLPSTFEPFELEKDESLDKSAYTVSETNDKLDVSDKPVKDNPDERPDFKVTVDAPNHNAAVRSSGYNEWKQKNISKDNSNMPVKAREEIQRMIDNLYSKKTTQEAAKLKERLLSNIDHFLEKYVDNDVPTDASETDENDDALDYTEKCNTVSKSSNSTIGGPVESIIQGFIKGYERLAYLGNDFGDIKLNTLFAEGGYINKSLDLGIALNNTSKIEKIISIDSVAHTLHKKKDSNGSSQYQILDELANISKSFGETDRDTRLLIINNPDNVNDIEKLFKLDVIDGVDIKKGVLEKSVKFWKLLEKAIRDGVERLSNKEIVALREWIYAKI